MRILPILAFTCLFGSISFAQGQSRTPSRPEPAQPAANAPAADTVDKSLPPAAVIPVSLLLVLALTVALGFCIERAAYKPLRSHLHAY